MEYRCVDRGSEKCPCHLTTAGQCYACKMLRTGECGCSAQWSGNCPYSELAMNAGVPKPLPRIIPAEIVRRKDYSGKLSVVRLEVPAGFAQQCHRLGSYIMAQAMGYMVPLSVLRSSYAVEKRKFVIGPRPYIEVAVQPAGLKTMQLANPLSKFWSIQGPFYSGLQTAGKIDLTKPMLVIAKGTAIAPFLNVARLLAGENPARINLFIDDDKVTGEFIADYVSGIGTRFNYIDLAKDMDTALALLDMYEQIFFLASPYYTNQVIRKLRGKDKIIKNRAEAVRSIGKCLVVANHANMCCGLGICGSCSHTDAEGVTVKKCKCMGDIEDIESV